MYAKGVNQEYNDSNCRTCGKKDMIKSACLKEAGNCVENIDANLWNAFGVETLDKVGVGVELLIPYINALRASVNKLDMRPNLSELD